LVAKAGTPQARAAVNRKIFFKRHPICVATTFAAANQKREQEKDRHIPNVQIVVRSDTGFGNRDLAGRRFALEGV